LDLSESGHQPMSDSAGRLTIVFNGEVFNYLELRAELAALGHEFWSGTDTEVVLAAFQHWGVAALHRFNGMWAFALWDSIEGRLICARDRFGVKPLYYVESREEFYFASEPQALVNIGVASATSDEDAAWDYLVLGLQDHTEHTSFKDVRQLPPGHYLLKEPGETARLVSYYHLPLDETFGRFARAQESSYVAGFLDLLRDSIRLRLRSDVPVASFLSGGIDSGLITAMVDGQIPQLTTFSAVYPCSPLDESAAIATSLAGRTSIMSRLIKPPMGDPLSNLEQFLHAQGEPVTSAGVYAQYRLLEEVRRSDFKVILGGDGADEYAGGYPHYCFPHLIVDLAKRLRLLQAVREAMALGLPKFGRFLLKACAGYLPSRLRMSALCHYFSTIKPAVFCLDRDFLLSRIPREARWNDSLMRGSLQSRLHHDMVWSNLGAILRYADRNSMAHSVELRLPFLDYRLVEYVAQIPAVYKVRHGWSKWIVRVAAAGYLHDDIRWHRDKRGFGEFEANAFSGAWRRFAEEGAAESPYIRSDKVRSARAAFTDDYNPTRVSLWRILNYELWYRHLGGLRATGLDTRRSLENDAASPGIVTRAVSGRPGCSL
jgi:asparagine synthase (glutamine-hydrolysing)